MRSSVGEYWREHGVLVVGGLVAIGVVAWGLRVHHAHKHPKGAPVTEAKPAKRTAPHGTRAQLPAGCGAEVTYNNKAHLFSSWPETLRPLAATCLPIQNTPPEFEPLPEAKLARRFACGGCERDGGWKEGECPDVGKRISSKFGDVSIDFIEDKSLGVATLGKGEMLLKDGDVWVKTTPLTEWAPLTDDDLESGNDVVMKKPEGGGEPQAGTMKQAGFTREYYDARGHGLFSVRVPNSAGAVRIDHEENILILAGGTPACDARIPD